MSKKKPKIEKKTVKQLTLFHGLGEGQALTYREGSSGVISISAPDDIDGFHDGFYYETWVIKTEDGLIRWKDDKFLGHALVSVEV